MTNMEKKGSKDKEEAEQTFIIHSTSFNNSLVVEAVLAVSTISLSFAIISDRVPGQFQNRQQIGPSIHAEVEVSLRDIYTGRTLEFEIAKQAICDECDGTGAKSHRHISDCDDCQGRGVKIVRQMLGPGMYQTVQKTCEKCNGKRKIITEYCSVCGGNRIRRGSSQLVLDIPPGAPEGHIITFENEGDEDPEWIPGDLIISIVSTPHPSFIRKGNHLYTTHVLGLYDALMGFEHNLTHVDGHAVKLKSEKVTQPGRYRFRFLMSLISQVWSQLSPAKE